METRSTASDESSKVRPRIHVRADDPYRRQLLTHKDRTLDKRNPYAGFKTEMELEAEKNSRVPLFAMGFLLAAIYLTKFHRDRELKPNNSPQFETLRKHYVGGSFPPDFEDGRDENNANDKSKE